MSVKISTTNTKLGEIPSVNLPPITTCRHNCPCAKDCYALKGNFRFKNVKQSHINNYHAYLEDKDAYFDDIKHAINNGFVSYSYFRWHSAGDIIDDEYFNRMVKLANDLPNTSFLAFTKKYEIINDYIANNGDLPQNLHIVLSAWDKNFIIENPYNLPVAHVLFRDETRNGIIPEDAMPCNGDCTHCLQCWNIKHGQSVVFHQH